MDRRRRGKRRAGQRRLAIQQDPEPSVSHSNMSSQPPISAPNGSFSSAGTYETALSQGTEASYYSGLATQLAFQGAYTSPSALMLPPPTFNTFIQALSCPQAFAGPTPSNQPVSQTPEWTGQGALSQQPAAAFTLRHPQTLISQVRSQGAKKTLNVDSPSFTPATLSAPSKSATISSGAANAAPFTPRGLASGAATPNHQLDTEPATFNPATIREFTPQSYDLSQNVASTTSNAELQVPYDPFSMTNVAQSMPATQYNPYLEDNTSISSNAAAFFPSQAAYTAPTQPLQYHLYAPMGPHREDLLPNQRHIHDFFMPENMRQEFQKKSEATLQVMPSFRLTNEKAIKTVKDWRKVDAGGVVSVIDAFTTRVFGDSSLIFVFNYHPLSKTLVETHFPNTGRNGSRISTVIPEDVLWSYIVQIATAIKIVHAAKLAVRCLDMSKIIVTSKNRIRLSACSVLDVVQYDNDRRIEDVQQEDLLHFGRLILGLGTGNPSLSVPTKAAVDHLARTHTPEFCDTVSWLITPISASNGTKSISEFMAGISSHIVAAFDSTLHLQDSFSSEMMKELENGRLARLLIKLGTINERPEYETDRNWSETGERYTLKLFRDFVFHQVDANGKAVVDLGHILRSLNKLDAGSEEKVILVSRDDQNIFVMSYKELKKQVGSAFSDLTAPPKTRY